MREFENILFSSLRYQLTAFQIKLLRFNYLMSRYKEKEREDKRKNKEREGEIENLLTFCFLD
jgi:hypothetical protein